MDIESTINSLRQNLDDFRSLGVVRLAVFGSAVSGVSTDGSDLDILVRFAEQRKTFDNFMNVRFLLESIFAGTKIDLVLEEAIKPAIRDQILSEAVDVA